MKKMVIAIAILMTALLSCKKDNADNPVDDCNKNSTTSVKYTNASSSPITITLKRQDQAANVFVITTLAPGESITKTFVSQLGVLYWGVNSVKNVAYQNICGTDLEVLN